MTLELEEEKAALIQHQKRIEDQEKKITNLSKMVVNFPVENRDERKIRKDRRETWCPRVLSENSSPTIPLKTMNRNIEDERIVNIFPITKRRNRLKSRKDMLPIPDESNAILEEKIESPSSVGFRDENQYTKHMSNHYKSDDYDKENSEFHHSYGDGINVRRNDETEKEKIRISPLKRSRLMTESNDMDDINLNHDQYEMFEQQIRELKAKNEILEEDFSQKILVKEAEIEELTEKIADFQLKELESIGVKNVDDEETENANHNEQHLLTTCDDVENDNFKIIKRSGEFCLNCRHLEIKCSQLEEEREKLLKKIESLNNELIEHKQKLEKEGIKYKNSTELSSKETEKELESYKERVGQGNENLLNEITSLKKVFSDKEENCSKLTRDLLELREEKAIYELNIERMNNELNECKDSLSETLFKMECMKHQNIQDANQMRMELTNLRKELNTAKTVPVAMEKEKESLLKDIDRIKSKCKDIENKLKCALGEKTSLLAEKTNLEKEVKSLRGQSNLLAKDFNKKECIMEKRRDSLNKAKLQLNTVENNLQTKSQLADQYLAELKTLQASYDSLVAKTTEFDKQVSSLEEEIKQMKDEKESICFKNDSIAKECDNLKESNSDLTFRIFETKSQLEKSRDENSKLSIKLSKAEDDLKKEKLNGIIIEELENKILQLSEKLNEATILMENEKNKHASKEIELNIMISNLNQKYFQIEKENEHLEKKLKEMNNDFRNMDIESKSLIAEYRDQIHTLEVTKMNKIHSLEGNILDLNSEIRYYEKMLEEKDEKLIVYEKKINESEEKLDKFSSIFYNSMKKLGKSKEEIYDYSKKVEELEERNAKNVSDFETKLEDQQTKIVNLLKENEERSEMYLTEKNKLDGIILQISLDTEKDKLTIKELTDRIVQLENTIAELESENSCLQSNAADLERQIADYIHTNSQYLSRIESLEMNKMEEDANMNKRIGEHQKEVLNLEKRFMEVVAERDDLKNEKEKWIAEEDQKNSTSYFLDRIEIEKEVINLTYQLNLMSSQLQDAESRLESEKLKLEIISSAKKESESSLEICGSKITKLQDMNRCLRKENKELKNKVSGLEFKYGELKDWVRDGHGNLGVFEKHAELKDAHHRLICSSIEIDELKLKISKLEKQNQGILSSQLQSSSSGNVSDSSV